MFLSSSYKVVSYGNIIAKQTSLFYVKLLSCKALIYIDGTSHLLKSYYVKSLCFFNSNFDLNFSYSY